MKIGLIGYGKMGKTIEKLSLQNEHTISAIIKNNGDWNTIVSSIKDCDVLIEFSTPETAFENIMNGLNMGKPVVCGTTGWLDHYDEIVEKVNEVNGTFLYASNFSIGVNQFFKLTRLVSSILSSRINLFNPTITEIHHIHKKDAPSGTAITLKELIKPYFEEIPPIKSIRENEVPGTHIIQFNNPIETIEIKHQANTREGFAYGAIKAAEWILGKKGIFSMEDVLDF